MLKVILAAIPEPRMIPGCFLVMSRCFSILYEMRNDMPPKTKIKTKRPPVDASSIWESSNRDLDAYAMRT